MRLRVPTLTDSNVIIRLTREPSEIAAANRLVFSQYVAAGFWDNDEGTLAANKFLHSPDRHVFIVLRDNRIVGTMSTIVDSGAGLPSDGPQPAAMRQLRDEGTALGEISAFAMDRSKTCKHNFTLFLISYMFQYSFYYLRIDRLVASCISKHADFYESALCFSRAGDQTYYPYTRVVGQLLSLDLLQADSLFRHKYVTDPVTGEEIYRFLFRDPQSCQRFPDHLPTKHRRSRLTGRRLQEAA